MARSALTRLFPDGWGAAHSAIDVGNQDPHAVALSMTTGFISKPASLQMAGLGEQAGTDESAQIAMIFDNAAELFSILSSPVRLKIICELNRKPSKVSNLVQRIQSSQPNISIHLRLLRQVGVVQKCRKSHYSISNHFIADICENICAI